MQDLHEKWLERGSRWFGPALFVLSFAVYLWTLCPGAFPGDPAHQVAMHSGLDPFPPMANPVWGRVVKFLGLFPFAGLLRRLNLFSALCGAGSVWLLYSLLSRVRHDRTAEEWEARVPPAAPQAFSGLVAALALAFSAPFWFVSTRAHPAAFDVFLLLFGVWVLLRFSVDKTPALMYLFAFLYGLGITEFATFIVWAPVFGLWLLVAMWRAGQLRGGPVLRMAGCWAAGLLMYGVAAAEYRLHPAYEWRAFTSIFQVLWFMWRDQYLAIRYSVPQVGWMLIFMTMLFPALVVALPKKAMTRTAVWSSNLLHLLFSLVGLLVLFNIRVSPWAMFSARPLLVTPYVLMALWFGYLGGYWLIYFSPYSSFASHRSILRRLGRFLMVPLVLGLLAAAAFRNVREADGRAGAAVRRLADEVVDRLDGRRWIVSNGFLDDMLRIAARERGIPLKMLNLGWGRQSAYLRYTASLFHDPRLQSLALVGSSPLMQEWLAQSAGGASEVAILAAPDVWTLAGMTPVPDGLVYEGISDIAELEAEAYFQAQAAFWQSYGQALKVDVAEGNSVLLPWANWSLAHLSKLANNAGVLLEDLGKTREAFAAYQASLELSTNNISALLNSAALAQREGLPEAGELEGALYKIARRMKRRPPLWSLSSAFGTVRTPEVFAKRGMAWAMSGKPDLAVAELQKAAAAGAPRAQIELGLAQIAALQRQGEQSETHFEAVLAEHPGSVPALMGMARLALGRNDFEAAAGFLKRARENNAPDELLLPEEALLDALAGRAAEAKGKLLTLAKQDKAPPLAWMLLAFMAMDDGDEELLKRAKTALQIASRQMPNIRLALAQIALLQRDPATARTYLEELLRYEKGSVPALESLIQLDLREGRRPEMEARVDELLIVDSRNPLGNHMLGLIQYARGQYDMAETSFRTSLAGRRSDSVLNDLAWILQMRGRHEESLKLAREAADLNPRNAASWDTIGVVLLHMQKPEEAQEALQRALALQPTHPHMILHMAEVYERRGMVTEAMQLAEPLTARAAEMSADAFEQLRRLMARLRGTSSEG
ncbi:MAG: tetratricopeptide repeat protein [Kiritimatiellae bacterium]|nr:tetratricopeptide repeat protein [Kiritimatiellia bacterium]